MDKWKVVSKELKEARDKRGIDLYVSADDNEYEKIISECKGNCKRFATPAEAAEAWNVKVFLPASDR